MLAQRFRWFVLQDEEEPVLADLEHLGADLHARARRSADVVVNSDSHVVLLRSGLGRAVAVGDRVLRVGIAPLGNRAGIEPPTWNVEDL